ncbi:MAG: hypothetical protein A2Y62_00615 [Candidatus Fischerbacteria bacterium RBG_13_37_8]|uniref:Gluconolaconase n=1 Tax=Candidatus Fischerbacteria bacterium RBG_13_37_8 TaxID=1817863 RepID=A0A1F5VNI5_9BACT|nr:MAG: hypothetical protein A2Y62_00615 [Candidatus Fischerbacteria bacterium RBG_13_37_8]
MKNKNVTINKVVPSAAIENGVIEIYGEGFTADDYAVDSVLIDNIVARKKFVSEDKIVVTIPEYARKGEIVLGSNADEKAVYSIVLGSKLADNLHCVDNPVVDNEGNWYVTYSGKRDESPEVSIFKVTRDGAISPYITNIKNATSMAFNKDGILFVSSRFEGMLYKVLSEGEVEVFAENLGIPTGVAITQSGYIYVGDRTGKIYKISPDGQTSLFAELPESLVAYHFALDLDENLFVSIPDISSVSSIYMIDNFGKSVLFYAGFGRPQGMAFDKDGNLYICEAKVGESALWCLKSTGEVLKIVASPPLIGVAFDQKGNLGLATATSLYKLRLGIYGKPH